jgi:hypothetical protein
MPRRSGRDGLFGWLVRLFPADFRVDFGKEMAADFQDQHADAAAAGRRSVACLWARTLVDVARRVPLEHLDVIRRDAGYALRLLRRRPAFAATVVLTLAIGVGLNTAVFSVVSGVLLRPLRLPNGDRVVRLVAVESTAPGDFQDGSSADFLDWQARTKTLDALALSTPSSGTLITEDGDPETIAALVVTERLFDIIRPARHHRRHSSAARSILEDVAAVVDAAAGGLGSAPGAAAGGPESVLSRPVQHRRHRARPSRSHRLFAF